MENNITIKNKQLEQVLLALCPPENKMEDLGIKYETGENRTFSTGAHKQTATGKGTPVLIPPDAMFELAKHFENGAILHGPSNWTKGIPLSEIINSLERHLWQEKMGLTDERHDRALAWNAIVYLATKLRIKAGILPKELDDIGELINLGEIDHPRLSGYCPKCREKILSANPGEAVAICEECAKNASRL